MPNLPPSQSFPFPGLTESEASKRLLEHGCNELLKAKSEGFLARSLKVVKEPMILLLLATGSIYFAMGDLTESIMLGLSIFVVIGISLYQERKSEKALAALRELSSPRALVIRDGKETRMQASALVPGDLVVLNEGDRVPADGILLQASNLSIDESLLTGESFPASKLAASDQIADAQRVFSSTLVVTGTAYFRVTHTGMQTEVGKIGKSLLEVEPAELNLTKEIRQMVRLFAWSGGIVCIAIVIIYGFMSGAWTQALLIGLSTQLSLLPEEFPVVLTIFLAMGAWRLSRINVLIRKPSSIERIGAITALCVDKTGTLTENRMTVAALGRNAIISDLTTDTNINLNPDLQEILEVAALASKRDPFDPMERAIWRTLNQSQWGQKRLHTDWQLVHEYPLSHQLLAMTIVWKTETSQFVATKGAPEAVADLCRLNPSQRNDFIKMASEMAARGLRVLGIAKAQVQNADLPADQSGFNYSCLGLIGFEDPLRKEVPNAVQLCRTAGIRVIMMTGDYPQTALIIASKAGLDTSAPTLTGQDLQKLNDSELTEKLKNTHVFARMVPEQKLRIVKNLKLLGHVVAMTGDGVNDAPSLKQADVGIAMGKRGTDVAREASDIVLLDDNFASIVSGVERGRMIFSNIRKAMSYIVSIHVPIAGLAILPVILNWPLMLLPIHIVFLELIIDPACSLMFESLPAQKGVMKVPPRSLKTRLFSSRDLIRSFLQGLFVLATISVVLWYEIGVVHDEPERARAFAFSILVMCNLGLIFADMSGGSLHQLFEIFKKLSNALILAGVLSILAIVTQVEAISTLFHFGTLNLTELAVASLIALCVFIIINLWNWSVGSRAYKASR